MCSAPSIVAGGGLYGFDRPGFIRSMAVGSRRGPKYPLPGQGCQAAAFTWGSRGDYAGSRVVAGSWKVLIY